MSPRHESAEARNDYIRDILAMTHSQIWSKFVEPLQPDIISLLPQVSANGIVRQPLVLEPHLPEDYRIAATTEMAHQNSAADPQRLVFYDPSTRIISAPAGIENVKELGIKELLGYAVGHDIASRQIVKPYFGWTPEERRQVEALFETEPMRGVPFGVNDTEIVKTGFRKRLVLGDYAIGELNPEMLAFGVDEVFATMFAMATRHIAERGNSRSKFEHDLRAGRIKRKEREDHPRFFDVFIKVARSTDMNWQQLLMAFRDGELNITREHLSFLFGTRADSILEKLIDAMREDENMINRINRGGR